MVDQYIEKYQKRYNNPREYANAHPRVLKAHIMREHAKKDYYFRLDDKRGKQLGSTSKIRINGYNFNEAKVLLIPKGKEYEGELERVKLDYKESELFRKANTIEKKNSKVQGYMLPVVSQDMNNIVVDLQSFDYDDEFDLVVYDNVDYDSIGLVYGFNMKK